MLHPSLWGGGGINRLREEILKLGNGGGEEKKGRDLDPEDVRIIQFLKLFCLVLNYLDL